MHTRALAFVVALATVTLAVAPAHAQRTQAASAQQNLVDLGRQQYDDLRYEEAIQTLSAAIIRRGNTAQSEIQIYELLALSYKALNRNDEAEGAFRLVLARDPAHHLSNELAPRILEFFNGVKQRWEAEGRPGVARNDQPASAASAPAVAIEHRSPAEQPRNQAIRLTANVNDPSHRVARLVLAYRSGSHGLFHRVDANPRAEGGYQAIIPAAAAHPSLVEYYFEAVGTDGVPLQARGDAFAPLRITIPGGTPWLLVGGGIVLVVGAAAAIIAGVVLSSGAQPATLTIQVQGH